jgi:hypothetical protein
MTDLTDDELDEFIIFWWGPDTDGLELSAMIENGLMSTFVRAVLDQWGGR